MNATKVLEFAGRQGVTRELIREVLRDEAKYMEWEQLLYPQDIENNH